MKLLDRRTAIDATKLAVFIVITTIATAMLAVTIGNISFGATNSYKAIFTDATGVTSGDDIRIAGVKVGNVTGVDVYNRTQALVSFKVDKDVPVTQGTEATIRYRNLVGQRYISLTQGVGSSDAVSSGSTIPMSRTHPALDLTVLFNGFKPLFQALSPTDVNKLAFEIIQVFQGEGGTLETLLQRTASVTNTLADRDDVIGALIGNLNKTLITVGNRDAQLSDLVVQLRKFVGGLANDRQAILGSLGQISDLSVQTADLVTGIRPGLTEDIKHLRTVATTIDRNKAEVNRALQVLPIKLQKVGRTAIYGSFFNFYLCDFNANVKLPGGTKVPINYSVGGRCNLG
jgi:phospholipid/cholesterol/gamma-HCH transport system substrate-binding protein